MDVITYALAKKMGGGKSITYTLTADTENKTIVLTPSDGTAQVITVPYATDASTVNGHEVPELENGKIPANFLPSFVDNVDEYDSISLFPVVGESNRIYIDKSTNKTYRWSGTAYVEISESIALGETSSTAYRGDRGKIAYDHSQSAHAPSNAEANQNAFSNVKIDSDIINASTKTDTLEFIAGDNIILTPNVSNKKITVSQVPVRKTASGNIASFSDGTGDPFLEVKANIVPVQSGSGDPSPQNVRPISGWSGANIYDAGGENIFDNSTFVKGRLDNGVIGYADNTTSMTITETGVTFTTNSNYRGVVGGLTPVVDGKSYYFDFDSDNASNISTFIDYYDSSSNWISRPTFSNLFTPPSNCSYVRISFQGKTSGTFTISNIVIYNTTIVSIPFHDNSDNPITVYGGMLNVTSGELRVDRASVDLGTLYWFYSTSYTNSFFYAAVNEYDYKNRGKALSSQYEKISNRTAGSFGNDARDGQFSMGTANAQIYIRDDRFTNVETFKTAMNGVQLVYELATPQTYQLTPAQVSTLLNQNNIFADCGQIEVAYKTPFYTDLTTKNEVQVLINESITSALNASY